jgi:hypothetical protein
MILVTAALACAACDSGDVAGPRLAHSTLTFTGPSTVDQTAVVINEFAARRGPNEECSEFVELLNTSDEEMVVGGWRLDVSGPEGATVPYATIPFGIVMAPGCHLLVATPPSGLLRDVPAACNLLDNGGLALVSTEGTIVDQVGMSSGSVFHEGRPLDTFDFNAVDDSYARVRNTGNNALDFVFGPATPDNQFAECATP